MSSPEVGPVPNDEVEQDCGNAYFHDTEIAFEDEDGVQWNCRRCGAEGWEDK